MLLMVRDDRAREADQTKGDKPAVYKLPLSKEINEQTDENAHGGR